MEVDRACAAAAAAGVLPGGCGCLDLSAGEDGPAVSAGAFLLEAGAAAALEADGGGAAVFLEDAGAALPLEVGAATALTADAGGVAFDCEASGLDPERLPGAGVGVPNRPPPARAVGLRAEGAGVALLAEGGADFLPEDGEEVLVSFRLLGAAASASACASASRLSLKACRLSCSGYAGSRGRGTCFNVHTRWNNIADTVCV